MYLSVFYFMDIYITHFGFDFRSGTYAVKRKSSQPCNQLKLGGNVKDSHEISVGNKQ